MGPTDRIFSARLRSSRAAPSAGQGHSGAALPTGDLPWISSWFIGDYSGDCM